MPLPQEGRKYTYADYLTWPEGERLEILDGVPSMQAAPTWQHQAISVQLTTQFNAHLKGTHAGYSLLRLTFVFLTLTSEMKKSRISHSLILL